MLDIASGADVAIGHVFNAGVATLSDDLGREIDFVMRWPDARTQLHNQVGRFGVEALLHRSDRLRNDSELRSFFSGMHQADGFANRIEKKYGAAIRDIDSETNIALVGHKPVARIEAVIV